MIVIVGAGLAGLSCALRLEEAGADFLVIEASGSPGGRVTTEVTPEGFRLDRGFQVLLDSYPTARALLDWDSLDLRPFDSGALLADGSHLARIRNPLIHPSAFGSALLAPFSLREKGAMVPLLLSSFIAPESGRRGATTSGEIKRRGLGGSIRERFLAPFFSGVFLEQELGTESSVFRRDLRYFATGHALLPAAGMGAIPEQLASRLPSARIRYGTRVRSLERSNGSVHSVLLEEGERIPCDRLVLATDEISSRRLLGLPGGRSWKSVTTLYFTGSEPLYDDPLIVLPRRPEGTASPLLHFADLTNVAPSYAPPGARLLTATLLGIGGEAAVREARRAISAIFPEFAGWSFLKEISIPFALPDQSPGYHSRMPDRRPGRDLWLAGDQVSRASIEDVMDGGLRTADEILQTF